VPRKTEHGARKVLSLDAYRRKRNLRRSGEPSGQTHRRPHRNRFVIQQHAASTEHFDFRLEVNGVLKSWAVPKGPSVDPRDKRLAVATEDHPLEYANFEGVIPEGEYGAGRVLVWDRGTYANLSHDEHGRRMDMSKALERGHVTVLLHGKKLQGGFSLTRFRGNRTGQNEDGEWLLEKSADEFADARRRPVSSQPESVKSGKRISQLSPGKGRAP
jgi:DNA ligase D-like protein (predicted 3'-phosphoesterase)